MKKNLLLSSVLLLLCIVSNATVHVVQVSNFQFSPVTMNVFVGDTVRYVWVSGNHTTTCDPSQDPNNSLPAGAATWDAAIKSSAQTFDYRVTVPGTYMYVCLPHAPNMAGSFVAQQNLPLKLSSFTLESSNSNVTLNWKTATEEKTNYFSVRRSPDGANYTEIATLPAAGSSTSERAYSFVDNKIGNQRFFYYNIAVVDRDGQQVMSETKLYKNTKATTKLVLSLSPNPIASPGHLNMTFNAEKEGQMQVKIINAEGKTLISRNMQAYVGVNKGHIHLGEQPAGIYTVICSMDGVTENIQVFYK